MAKNANHSHLRMSLTLARLLPVRGGSRIYAGVSRHTRERTPQFHIPQSVFCFAVLSPWNTGDFKIQGRWTFIQTFTAKQTKTTELVFVRARLRPEGPVT